MGLLRNLVAVKGMHFPRSRANHQPGLLYQHGRGARASEQISRLRIPSLRPDNTDSHRDHDSTGLSMRGLLSLITIFCHMDPVHVQVLREMAQRVRDDGTDDFQDVDWCKVPAKGPRYCCGGYFPKSFYYIGLG